jgi:hypothetical protein
MGLVQASIVSNLIMISDVRTYLVRPVTQTFPTKQQQLKTTIVYCLLRWLFHPSIRLIPDSPRRLLYATHLYSHFGSMVSAGNESTCSDAIQSGADRHISRYGHILLRHGNDPQTMLLYCFVHLGL